MIINQKSQQIISLREITHFSIIILTLYHSCQVKKNSGVAKSPINYNTMNKEKHYPEKYYHNILFMYYPFRREEELKGRSPLTYSQKYNELEVAAVVNRNRRLIEPYAELVDEAYERMQNTELNNEDSSAQHYIERESF